MGASALRNKVDMLYACSTENIGDRHGEDLHVTHRPNPDPAISYPFAGDGGYYLRTTISQRTRPRSVKNISTVPAAPGLECRNR